MIDALSLLLRWLDLSGAAIALGAWLLAARASRLPVAGGVIVSATWHRTSLPFVSLTVALFAAACGLALRAAAVADMAPPSLDLRTLADFALDTQSGRWRTLRVLLLLLAWASAFLVFRSHGALPSLRSAALLGALGLAQAAAAGSGHAAGSGQPLLDGTLQALHVLAASVWFGGLCLMAQVNQLASLRPAVPALLRAFSPLALAAMVVIVATGTVGAIEQLERWPPLFGTAYGHTLLAKLAALALALVCAAVLRQRWLPRLNGADATAAPALRRWLLVEAAAGAAVFACAGRLGTLTPGRHDAIQWPFAFRLAWDVTASQPDVASALWAGAGIVGGGVLVAAGLAWVLRLRRWAATVAVLSVAVGGGWALPRLAVDAHADAYRASSVAYEPVSIANGRRLYLLHCTGCHGIDADGRGPLAAGQARPPADLTAAHARDHTPGDLYDWLSRGMRGGWMPGFGDRLSEDDRWDLVNYLHTLATGYQARVIQPRIAARNPWLAAPAFTFETLDGQRGSLRDLRDRHSVLLVFDGPQSSSERLRRLQALQPQLEAAGVRVLTMPMSASVEPKVLMPAGALTTLRHDGDVVLAYMLFRRTLERLRPGESGAWPSHAEFLIDRFGYLRARWIPDDAQPGWDDAELLLSQARALSDEPRLKPPPDDHLH